MKNTIAGILLGIALGGFVTWTLFKPHDSAGEKEHAEASHVHHGTNGETLLKLDQESRERVGLKVEPIAAVRLNPEVRGFGRVLDPAPLTALVAELLPAHVAAEASRQEFERTRSLHAQNNASTRSLQAAEAVSRRDQLLLDSLRTRLVLTWGGAIAGLGDLPSFVRPLTTLEHALVRIDVPAGETLKSAPVGARLVLFGPEASPMEGQFLGPAPGVDPQTQGQGFMFLVKDSRRKFAPGAAVTGYLRLDGEAQNGAVVPRNAVVRAEGRTWVYLQTAADSFTRREILLDRPLDTGWFVRSGVAAQENVVTVGAQQLLSEELKSRTKEE